MKQTYNQVLYGIPIVFAAIFLAFQIPGSIAQVRALEKPAGTQPIMAKWRGVGGVWHESAGGLIGTVDGATRGFAVADDALAAGPQLMEAEITPQQRIGESWSACGLCLYAYSGGYWRLALAEGPDKQSRYAELTLMDEGVGIGNSSLKLLNRSEQPFDWRWNAAYRLRLEVMSDRITGEIFSMDGVRRWSETYSLSGSAFIHFGWPAVGVQGMQCLFRTITQSAASPASPESAAMRCKDLEEKQTRSLWLSLPKSRLVVNPTMSTASPAPIQIAPWLPVNAAYYSGATPIQLPYLWGWRSDETRVGAPPAISITMGPQADFSPSGEHIWQSGRLSATFLGKSVRLVLAQPPFGSLSTTVSVDLDKTPSLMLPVNRLDGQWALKVNAGDKLVDTYVQHDTKESGSFVYDLPAITGWHGKHTFKLILFAIGDQNQSVEITGLRFAGVSGHTAVPEVKESSWYPHQIVQRAADASGALSAESSICLPDENTVAQRLTVKSAASSRLTLSGQLPPGRVKWDEAHHALIYNGPAFQEVMTISRSERWLGTFDSVIDQVAKFHADTPGGNWWAMNLDDVMPGDEIVVTARFGRPDEPLEKLIAGAEQTANPVGFQLALGSRERAWNTLLSHVPIPIGFALHALKPHGSSPDSIRRAYFRAWVFLLSDIVPPLPENGFNYPQVACGKPSLWSEGAKRSEATSQWESFIGMQYLAFVDPQTAWDSFTGEMSLVGEDGSIGGEGLPSRHAQTAWILYSITRDLPNLKAVYPNLKRLLTWKAAHPRWIYHSSTPEDEKDCEFVVHALMDMEYAKRISHVLGMPTEESYWDLASTQLTADYHRWFWDERGHSYRLYRTSTGRSESPELTWNLEGLALPPEILKTAERDSLLSLFRASVHPDMPFLIPALSAFPKYNFTVRGMWQYGRADEIEPMIESAMRDTTLAGEFSEDYMQSFPVSPQGVTPSIFGAAQIIDNTLWHNGIMLGDGSPNIVRISKARGVTNLNVNGKLFDVLIDEGADLIVLQGAGLSSLKTPDGFRASTLPDGTPRWDGKLSGIKQISLEFKQ